jgi:threonine/homoserine/homoserine lactone efflux protein
VPTAETLLAFAIVSAGLIVLPGPSNLFILAHGIGQGRRAARAAVLGIATASALRVLLACVGLSALLASSAVAFDVLRWAGVAYLLYLAVSAWCSRHGGVDAASSKPAPPKRHSYLKGLAVGLGNPKMALFFLAFFPQFIDPAQGSAATQMLVLGTVFWVIGTAWDFGCAMASDAIGQWLRRRPRMHAFQGRAEGTAYFGLAVWTALSGQRARH